MDVGDNGKFKEKKPFIKGTGGSSFLLKFELGSVQGEEFFKKAFSVSFSLCLIQHNKVESYIKN